MNFSFNCISCNQHAFSIDSESIMYSGVPIVTFVCPECNVYNKVESSRGGLIVSVDAQAKDATSKSSSKA